ncbi:hypothetical protein Tco_0411613 [Tanacetum coccineum]
MMKTYKVHYQGEAAAADSKKGYSNNRSQEQSRRQSNDQSSSRNNSYRGQRGGRGNDKYTPLTMTPKEILATEGSNFPKPPPMRTLEEQRVGNGYCEYHRQKGHTTNECVQLRQLIDKLVKEGRLDHLVKNIKEGKDKQRSGGKKDAPRDKADTIYMVQSWQRKTKQKRHDIHPHYNDGGASADIRTNIASKDCTPEVKKKSVDPADDIVDLTHGEKSMAHCGNYYYREKKRCASSRGSKAILEEYINSWRQYREKSITMIGSPNPNYCQKEAMVAAGCAMDFH